PKNPDRLGLGPRILIATHHHSSWVFVGRWHKGLGRWLDEADESSVSATGEDTDFWMPPPAYPDA
ncbi:MAG: hypothetical protein AAGH68_02235, partial [Pseudomonadota bacterium]